MQGKIDYFISLGLQNKELQVQRLYLLQNNDNIAKNTPKKMENKGTKSMLRTTHYHKGVNVQDLFNRQFRGTKPSQNSSDSQNMVLYTPSISDSQRLTKINIEWLKNNNVNNNIFQQYYSKIYSQSVELKKNMISNRETEVRIIDDEKTVQINSKDIPNHFDSHAYHQSMTKVINNAKPSSKIAFSNIYNTNKLKYIVTSGNNSKLIREAMKRRPWWVEIPNVDSVFNFKWQPVSYRMKFRDLTYKPPGNKQIVNHFEFHKYLSEKSELFS